MNRKRSASGRVKNLAAAAVLMVVSLLLASCSVTGSDAAGANTVQAVGVDAVADPDNTLLAAVTVTGQAGSGAQLLIESDGLDNRILTSNEAADSHTFQVVGLRAETEYRFTAEVDGSQSETVPFLTGALPENAPTAEIVTSSVDPDTDGITFFGLPSRQGETQSGPTYFGVDSAGHVVWYLNSDLEASRNPFIRHLEGNEILATSRNGVVHMTLDGTVLNTYDLSSAGSWHHDYRLLENGNLLILETEEQRVGADLVQGDLITEIDAAGERVWEWSLFDHLDVTRFPGDLSLSTTRAGGLDWTHANSLWVDEASGQILTSIRSQGWILSIDQTTGEINWIAGDSSGTAADFDAPFLTLGSGTWTTGQHTAMFTQNGELLAYDNRNESGGETELSRAVIYSFDTGAKTADQVFEASANKYTSSLGDVDELSNGNIFITAGGSGNDDKNARLIEVNRSGGVVWEAALTDQMIYRSERIPWANLNGSTTQERQANGPAVPDPSTGEDAQANGGDGTDITNATLTATDSSCLDYVGHYTSEVSDASTGESFTGETVISNDGGTCLLETNSIPNHDFGQDSSFHNTTGEVAATYKIPGNPELAAEPTPLLDDAQAILLNGVSWQAFPAACFDQGDGNLGTEMIGCSGQLDHPWRYNIGSDLNSRFGVDAHFAHTQQGGYYHYHQTPSVLHETDCAGTLASPVIGFARDGFPIFGPCFEDDTGTVRPATSSHQPKTGPRQDVEGFTTPYPVGDVASDEYDGQFIGDYEFSADSGDLDECNGMTVNGTYGYYLTGEYPYVLACFSGTPAEVFGRSDR